MRVVEVLPFVPVRWMTGKVRCGSPRSSMTAVMRSREGWSWCSGARARIASSASRIRLRISRLRAASRWAASGAGVTGPFSRTFRPPSPSPPSPSTHPVEREQIAGCGPVRPRFAPSRSRDAGRTPVESCGQHRKPVGTGLASRMPRTPFLPNSPPDRSRRTTRSTGVCRPAGCVRRHSTTSPTGSIARLPSRTGPSFGVLCCSGFPTRWPSPPQRR